jgi:hypothetical protein
MQGGGRGEGRETRYDDELGRANQGWEGKQRMETRPKEQEGPGCTWNRLGWAWVRGRPTASEHYVPEGPDGARLAEHTDLCSHPVFPWLDARLHRAMKSGSLGKVWSSPLDHLLSPLVR